MIFCSKSEINRLVALQISKYQIDSYTNATDRMESVCVCVGGGGDECFVLLNDWLVCSPVSVFLLLFSRSTRRIKRAGSVLYAQACMQASFRVCVCVCVCANAYVVTCHDLHRNRAY